MNCGWAAALTMVALTWAAVAIASYATTRYCKALVDQMDAKQGKGRSEMGGRIEP